MPRAIWKGAISFGLVHVPVSLYPASQEVGIDFDWLDKRSMDPVGYQRVNKRTGKEIQKDDIVKGIKQDDGDYVLLSEDEIKAAFPKSTQTIEIEAFVKASEIPFVLLERPYFLEPLGKGDKVYALLRESMLEAGVIGIARVVMHTKEHLAALIPSGAALMLNTIRWASEMRPADELKLPAEPVLSYSKARFINPKLRLPPTKNLPCWKVSFFSSGTPLGVLSTQTRPTPAYGVNIAKPLEMERSRPLVLNES